MAERAFVLSLPVLDRAKDRLACPGGWIKIIGPGHCDDPLSIACRQANLQELGFRHRRAGFLDYVVPPRHDTLA